MSQYLRIWIRSDRRNMDNLKRKWSSRPIESVSHPSWKDISIMKQALCQPITIPWTAYPLPLTHNSNSYTIRSQIHIVIFNHSKHSKIHKGNKPGTLWIQISLLPQAEFLESKSSAWNGSIYTSLSKLILMIHVRWSSKKENWYLFNE